VPGLLRQLESMACSAMMRWTELEPLRLSPSGYFARHCTVGNSLMSRSDVDLRAEVGLDVLAWGSDFPHLEGSWPSVRESLKGLFDAVPAEEARRLLGANLARAYRVDPGALAPLVERIGPLPAELGLA